MNLSLMPFRLNLDFSEVADQVTFIDSYNGARLYKVNQPSQVPTEFPLTDIHLYFLEEKLITVYLHLENNLDHIEALVRALTLEMGLKGVISRSQFGLKYRWDINGVVLVLVKDQIHRKFYVYYATESYSVY